MVREMQNRDAFNALSNVEQPAHSFTSIHVVNRWLDAKVDAPSSPEYQRLRAAVVLLLQKRSGAKRETVCALCSAWGVHRRERQADRPIATVIAELQQAVLFEGTRLRARALVAQTGVSASSTACGAMFRSSSCEQR